MIPKDASSVAEQAKYAVIIARTYYEQLDGAFVLGRVAKKGSVNPFTDPDLAQAWHNGHTLKTANNRRNTDDRN